MTEWLRRLYPDLDRLLAEVSTALVDSERNRGLREEIVRRFLAQLLTDDERARLFGLPASCRVREGAKILMPARLSAASTCGSAKTPTWTPQAD